MDASSDHAKLLIEGSNKFAMKLYNALSKDPEKNVIFSPLSIEMVLALAYLGLKGTAAEEISSTLGLPADRHQILTGHNALIKQLKHPVLNLANKMFIEKCFEIKETFQKEAVEFFLSEVQSMSFQTQPEQSRVGINKWVEDNTNKKIQDLLAPGLISPDTRLVLVNAVHFKANWTKKFDENRTRDDDFYITPNKTVKTKMMNIEDKFGYKEDENLDAQILEMSYEDCDFRMFIVLPKEKDGLPKLVAKLSEANLSDVFQGVYQQKVNVTIPKFKLEDTMDLNDILKEIGIKTIFNKPDFSGITEGEDLEVSAVVQKAFIEVNEEGTEAAAATGMVIAKRKFLRKPVVPKFIADHQFLFFITHCQFDSVLFLGSIGTPSN